MDLWDDPPFKALWIGPADIPNESGSVEEPDFYIPVPVGLSPYVLSALTALCERELWRGTDDDYFALQSLITDMATTRLRGTFMEDVRLAATIVQGQLRYHLYKFNDALTDPLTWPIAGDVVGAIGPQGPEGPEGPQGPVGPEGPPGPQGIVQAGFMQLYTVDNGDGTATVWRQWYCRTDPQDNLYEPDGDPVQMNTITGPVGPRGPRGDFPLITSSNPEPHVAYFWRQTFRYEDDGTLWGPIDEPVHYGGVIAPEGPPGEPGADGLPGAPGPRGGRFRPRGYRRSGSTYEITEQYEEQNALGQWTAIGNEQRLLLIDLTGMGTGSTEAQSPIVATDANREYLTLGLLIKRYVEAFSAVYVDYYTNLNVPFYIISLLLGHFQSRLPVPVNQLSNLTYFEPLDEQSVRDAITQAMYCVVIPHRSLSSADFSALYTNHSSPNWAHFVVDEGSLQDTLISAILYYWYNHQAEVIAQLSNIRLNGEVDPTFDYSTLPCTPVAETPGQRIYDFTVAPGPFVPPAGLSDGSAEWIAGVGWRKPSNKVHFSFAIENVPDPTTITEIRIWTQGGTSSFEWTVKDGKYVGGSSRAGNFYEAFTGPSPSVLAWVGSKTLTQATRSLMFWGRNMPTNWTLTRIEIAYGGGPLPL